MVHIVLAAFLAAALAAQPQKPTPAFHDLLRTGDVEALTAALDKDPALTNQRDRQGCQPIFWAGVYGQRAVVDLLLGRGADPRSSSPLGTALHGAVVGGNPDILRALAAKGADVNARGETRVPPLILAVRRGQLPVIETLLDLGAAPDATDAMGNTALLMAASYGLDPVVRLLVSRQAGLDIPNSRGSTPLDVARREGHTEIAVYLEAHKAVARVPIPDLSGPYLAQTPPGLVPALFAPGFVSTERRELNAAFTPDGQTLFFARDRYPRGTLIMMTSFNGTRWTRPVAAPFSRDGESDVDVFVTADGREVYFCSERAVPGAPAPPQGTAAAAPSRPSDIWMVTRTASGWSRPTWLGPVVNSDAADYYPTLTRAGTLYFSSNRRGGLGENDIYAARRRKGRWTTPENLGPGINTASREYDPFIAPDESYLIFASERPGGLGAADLYISFRDASGAWGDPANLGAAVNSPAAEYTPMLSPDGKFLFFTSNREGQDDIYWVQARVIDRLRPAERR